MRHNKLEEKFVKFYEEHELILYQNYNNLRYFVMTKLEANEIEDLEKYFKSISTRKFKKGERSKVYSLFRYIKDDSITIEILRSTIKEQPNNVDAYKELANISIKQERPEEAISYLSKALEYEKDSTLIEKVLLISGKAWGTTKSYGFLEKFKLLISRKEFIYFKGYLSIIHRNYKEAIIHLSLLIDLDKELTYKNAITRILNPCLHEEKFNDYQKYLELYIKLNPNAMDINTFKYKYFYYLKDWSSTIEYTNKALEDGIKNNQAFDRKVKALIKLEKYNEVNDLLFLTINKYNISEYVFIYLKGVYTYHLLQYDEAIKYFEEVIKLRNNDYAEALRWLLKSYKQNQDSTEAEVCFWKYEEQYAHKNILVLNLADSASLLSYIEQKYKIYSKNPMDNNELSEWFIKYLLRHRYWGRAYLLIKKLEGLYGLSDFLLKNKEELENSFFEVNIDIQKEYKNKNNIEGYKSSELVFSRILDKVSQNRKQCIEDKKIRRVALVLTSLGPGGAERQCVNVFNGLLEKVKQGELEDVRLFVTSLTRSDRESFYLKDVVDKSKVYEYYDRTKDIDIEEVKSLEPYQKLINLMQPITRQQTIISLTKYLEDFNPTVIHGWQNEAILNSFLVGGILNTCSLLGRWGSLPPTISRNLTEVQSRNVDYIHYAYKVMGEKLKHKTFSANSNIAAQSYSEWINYTPVRTIYNGLNIIDLKVTIDKESMKNKLGLDKNSLVVGSIYRISDEKRPFLWVDIANKVNQIFNEPIHFVLVGDGPLKGKIDDYIKKKNLQEFVHLVGRQDDVANWYNIMDVFLLTSAVEGISNSMLEAEYMGIPVIVPDVGGLKEAIIEGKNGFLISDASIDNFSNKIVDILSSKWGEKDFSKKYIEEKFSISNMIENTLAFYKDNIDGDR